MSFHLLLYFFGDFVPFIDCRVDEKELAERYCSSNFFRGCAVFFQYKFCQWYDVRGRPIEIYDRRYSAVFAERECFVSFLFLLLQRYRYTFRCSSTTSCLSLFLPTSLKLSPKKWYSFCPVVLSHFRFQHSRQKNVNVGPLAHIPIFVGLGFDCPGILKIFTLWHNLHGLAFNNKHPRKMLTSKGWQIFRIAIYFRCVKHRSNCPMSLPLLHCFILENSKAVRFWKSIEKSILFWFMFIFVEYDFAIFLVLKTIVLRKSRRIMRCIITYK